MWDSAGAAMATSEAVRAAAVGERTEAREATPASRPRPGIGPPVGDGVSEVVRQEIRPLAGAVRTARRCTAATLHRWDMGELGDVVELVVSELVTNALRHGLADRGAASRHGLDACVDGPCPVELIVVCGARLRCVVTDPSDRAPVRCVPDLPDVPDVPDDVADGGRGLNVVAALSSDWGWSRCADGGKAVWAAFDRV